MRYPDRMKPLAAALLAATLTLGATPEPIADPDLDRDSLPDRLEQQLLDRFAPTFLISAADCDARPARFTPGVARALPLAQDGAIYGQAFRHATGAIELHYYHLWTHDCGRFPHPLDAEHVSALITLEDGTLENGTSQNDPTGARALYWTASAHQATVCDATQGARAQAIAALFAGPTVWVSNGKHASYFRITTCAAGCGGDHCDRMAALPRRPIVNLGEPGAPLNGALWTSSPSWPLADKMQTDFPPEILAKLDAAAPREIVRLSPVSPAVQGVIATSNTTADALALSGAHTDAALDIAGDHTGNALRLGAQETGKSLKKARRSVLDWLRDHF